jgi:hypothetical protein
MPSYAPQPSELPLVEDDATVEVDMRWLLKDRPGLRAKFESSGSDAAGDATIAYDMPESDTELTDTQVGELLNPRK